MITNSKTLLFLFAFLFLLVFGFKTVQAQSAAPSIDTKATYVLTNMFLGEGVALDGVGANQRPAMKTANAASNLQKWQFADLGNGYYRIFCVGVGTGAALEGGAKDQGALMNGVANQSGQMWRLADAGNGYVTLVNMFTEKDNYAFEGGSLNGGALITVGGHSGQAWKLTKVQGKVADRLLIGGTYSFECESMPGKFISHNGALGRASLAAGNNQFKVVAPLNGKAGYVSLQPVGVSGDNYLVMAETCPRPYTNSAYYNIAVRPAATDASFNDKASFQAMPAMGSPADLNLVSFGVRGGTHLFKREQGVFMDAPGGGTADRYMTFFRWKLKQI